MPLHFKVLASILTNSLDHASFYLCIPSSGMFAVFYRRSSLEAALTSRGVLPQAGSQGVGSCSINATEQRCNT